MAQRVRHRLQPAVTLIVSNHNHIASGECRKATEMATGTDTINATNSRHSNKSGTSKKSHSLQPPGTSLVPSVHFRSRRHDHPNQIPIPAHAVTSCSKDARLPRSMGGLDKIPPARSLAPRVHAGSVGQDQREGESSRSGSVSKLAAR